MRKTIAIVLLLSCGASLCAQTNIQALSFLSNSQMSGFQGNDIWGWTDPQTGREYAIMGMTDRTSFVDVTNPTNPQFLGHLPSHTGDSLWRDMKVYQDHAYIVSDGNGPHGMQIFDLTNLRGITSPQTFSASAHYNTGNLRNAHNIAINEDSGYAYIVGANVSAGGLHILDLSNPLAPTFAGEFTQDGYTHDVQVLNYEGPDARYFGREIAFAANEDTLTIVDVTNKLSPSFVSSSTYPSASYTHQGWLSEDGHFFYLNDEGDSNWTHIYDVTSLDSPQYIGTRPSTTGSQDHNLYVKGNYIYEANYGAGLRIFEQTDPANNVLTEVAWWDTGSAWSVYPYFESGTIIVSNFNGLAVARLDLFDADFNYDGAIDMDDINLLYAELGSSNADFDLDGNGIVNNDDVSQWLQDASDNDPLGRTFRRGDANLDGDVGGVDFSVLASNFGQPGLWADGNFDVDPIPGGGTVGGRDFSELAASFGFTSVSAVPEPSVHGLWASLLIGLLLRRTRTY